MTGVWVLIGALAVAGALGLAWRAGQGRIKEAGPSSSLPPQLRALLDPSAQVTLLQLSTTFCTPCRQTRALLAGLAEQVNGLRHVDFDVTDHVQMAAALGIARTPTTLAVDSHGVELMRVGGVPDRGRLLDALRPHLPE